MTDYTELNTAQERLLIECMQELTKVKNDHTATCKTLSTVRTELSDTKTNLATTNPDLDNIHLELSDLRHSRLSEHSETYN